MLKKRVAVFDIDGTIFRSSLLLELAKRLIQKDIIPRKAQAEFEQERLKWLDRKGDYPSYVNKVVQVFGREIKGASYDEVMEIAEAIVLEKKDRVYRYTRDLIKKLKQRGYFLLGISHSPRFIVDVFAYEHGFDKVYGMFYTVGPSGKFTGQIEDEDLIKNKAAVLQRAVRKENLTLGESVGAGDTESDIPMLELVERPIAFNPNAKLYAHAKKRDWPVVVERKDVVYEF